MIEKALGAAWSIISSNTVWTALAAIAALLALWVSWKNSKKIKQVHGLDYRISLDESSVTEIIYCKIFIENRRDSKTTLEKIEIARPKGALMPIKYAYDAVRGKATKAYENSGSSSIVLDETLEVGGSWYKELALLFDQKPKKGKKVIFRIYDRFHAGHRKPNRTIAIEII